MEGLIICSAGLWALIATVVQSLTEREKKVGHPQKLTFYTYAIFLVTAIEKLIGNCPVYTETRAGEVF